jgi:hypothetical protein
VKNFVSTVLEISRQVMSDAIFEVFTEMKNRDKIFRVMTLGSKVVGYPGWCSKAGRHDLKVLLVCYITLTN